MSYVLIFVFQKKNVFPIGREQETHSWLWHLLCFGGCEAGKNPGEEVRAMNGFCLQSDNLVMAGESSRGPKGHLSCELNSTLTPLEV